MRGLVGFLAGFAVLFGASEVSASVMSISEFRLEIRDAIRKLDGDIRIEFVDEDTLRLVGRDDDDANTVFVGNAYRRYVNSPDEWETIVAQMARLAVTANAEVAPTKEAIVVLIRPKDYLNLGDGKDSYIFKPFAGDFIEVIAVDSAETFRIGDSDKIVPLFSSLSETWIRAAANTKAKTGPLHVEMLEPGVWTVTAESSLALHVVNTPELWSVYGIKMKGEPLAMFLQRNLLLLADSDDKERVGRLTRFMAGLQDDPDTLSTTMFIRHGDQWSVLEQRP